jgi:hypothetical protein
MLQPQQDDVGDGWQWRRFGGAAEKKRAHRQDETRPKGAAIISWRPFHYLLWFTNFGQISGLANIFGTVAKECFGRDGPFPLGAVLPPNESLRGPITRAEGRRRQCQT